MLRLVYVVEGKCKQLIDTGTCQSLKDNSCC
eukprot:COSAG06_NODE_53229_length_301_cov_0.767327_2_plen_30_part_01